MKLHFLSGLPRSGSTLLTSILYQNPEIHAEGVSGLCDLMWNASQSVERNASLNGNRRDTSNVVEKIPELYYSDVQRNIIIDKCRSWTFPLNMQVIKRYITKTPKVICCTRSIADIEKSFVNLFKANGRDDFYSSVFADELQISAIGLNSAINENNPEVFHFVDYNNLISRPQEELEKIYNFLDIEHFEHDFNNVINTHKEDDALYGLYGMHDVRGKVGAK
jgi:sulfotransferase